MKIYTADHRAEGRWSGLRPVIFLSFVFLLLIGCGDRSETVYQEKAPVPTAATLPANHPQMTAPATPAQEAAPLAWDLPQGWDSSSNGGMRLATLHPVPGDETLLCTLVPLKGNAGGLASNVVRWLEQMGESAPAEPELSAFLDSLEKFESFGKLPVVVVDLSNWGTNKDDTRGVILAAIVTIGEDSLFVKMSGPSARVRANKDGFLQLCRSLRHGEKS